ncbi:hypothetical protein ACHAWO_011798 [Cyclotella atomus]|uniref:Fe2OG dioxygenase domain-containing protein n=1 Tax=Cyclotella atomus TaxID=382360 RepID=A0ABD3NJ21_9STRA
MRLSFVPILLPAVQSFSLPRRFIRPHGLRLQSTVEEVHVSSANVTPSCSHPDSDVLDQNVQAHMEVVHKSEETFYGFYPDGFKEFDLDNAPSSWISYSLEVQSDEKQPLQSTSERTLNIWDTFTQLDKRIIPPPFTSHDLARVSQTPILSPDECKEIINECDNHYWGWSSSNERYGTPSHRVGHMLKLEDLSRSYTLVNFELLPRLFPAIMSAFPSLETNAENLRLGGCRVVKYDASEGRVELGLHRDGLLVTANIALNDWTEYEGGGTFVEGLPDFMNNPIRLQKGHVLLHPGDVRHGGAPITKGIRYVLVCFILDTSIVPHEKYCQDRMQRDVDAARLIPVDDESRTRERSDLLTSATKHCADAFSFGSMSCDGESTNGYEDILREFNRFVKLPGEIV